jgi:hypothetical protein
LVTYGRATSGAGCARGRRHRLGCGHRRAAVTPPRPAAARPGDEQYPHHDDLDHGRPGADDDIDHEHLHHDRTAASGRVGAPEAHPGAHDPAPDHDDDQAGAHHDCTAADDHRPAADDDDPLDDADLGALGQAARRFLGNGGVKRDARRR